MTIGLLLWAVATLLMGFVGGFLSLLVLRVMLGVGESIAFPGTSKIIAEQVPAERRGIANSAVSLGIALGPAAGTLAGGLILASWGWRPIFIIFGLVTLLWLLTAVVLFVIGVRWKSIALRLASITLMGITLVKLVLLDSLTFSTVQKVIAYLVLGVLLLLVSYFYQKFRQQLFEE